ncbi:MAG: DUF922 domain-containing protein [Rhizobiaceae bacterium]
MKRSIVALTLVAVAMALPAQGAGLSKKYSYFSIGGSNLEELEKELGRRGPKVRSTGRRHPGATQMEFNTSVTYARGENTCRVEKATVVVKAKIILPRWRARGRADRETRIVWDTLSADIKRHEESHVIIAKNHAHELEKALMGLGRAKSCDSLEAKGQKLAIRVMEKHDEAQARFDRVEGINFEARMLRLLKYRIKRIEDGRISGG